jgi:hypothetical protein
VPLLLWETLMSPSQLEKRFTTSLVQAVDECKRIGYNPSYFRQMLAEHGGVETARRLIDAPTISDGFIKLWELKRLDLLVEALVLRSEWAPLFTREELAKAALRLDEFGYQPKPS